MIILIILLLIFCPNTYAATMRANLTQAMVDRDRPFLMPLGDSIARGSVGGGVITLGFRGPLQDDYGRIQFDFVGTSREPSDQDPPYDIDHSGVGGERSYEIEARTGTELTNHMTAAPAGSVVILGAGTNDILQSESTTNARDNVEDIIDLINAFDPTISVYVFLITPLDSGFDSTVTSYNALLKTMLDTYRVSKSNLYYIDMNSVFKNDTFGDCAGDWAANCIGSDNIHPTADGYASMAKQIEKCLENERNTNCNGN